MFVLCRKPYKNDVIKGSIVFADLWLRSSVEKGACWSLTLFLGFLKNLPRTEGKGEKHIPAQNESSELNPA